MLVAGRTQRRAAAVVLSIRMIASSEPGEEAWQI
jgi:hypothetical protein